MKAERIRLRYVAPLRSKAVPHSMTENIAFLPMDAIGDDGDYARNSVRLASDIESGYTYLKQGDVIRARVTPCFENRKGAWLSTLTGGEGFGTTELFVFKPSNRIDPRFLYYVTMSDDFINRGTATMYGAHGVRRVDERFALDYELWVPPVAVQNDIANYLDRETARVDALMNQKQRLVGLLEEKWAAIRNKLTEFDDLAERWPSVQLRRVAKVQAGAAFPHADQGDRSGTIPYVKVSDLGSVDREGRIQDVSNRVAPDVARKLRSPILSPGTIVLPKIGAALLGNTRAFLSEPSCLDQNVMGVTVQSGDPRFVYHSLGSIDLGEFSTPGPVPLLNEGAALSVCIPWPPIETQRKIAAALDEHDVATLAPRRVVLRQMILLQERRQALITAAVTGQLDIPEAA